MEKFVPADKLSKKKRRELNSGRRKIWTVRPQTKRIESKKHYSRRPTKKCDHNIIYPTRF